MTTSPSGAADLSRRSSNRAPLLWALAALAVLLIAAAWPMGGNAPSVLSAATADTKASTLSAAAATAATHDLSLPDTAAVFAGQPDNVDEPAPSF